jgi:hypothetical protein
MNAMSRASMLVLMFVAATGVASAQIFSDKADPDLKKFELVIRAFIEGKDLTPVKSMILPEAYIVHGNSYESLFNFLDKDSREKLFGDSKRTMNFFAVSMNDEKTSAYIVVKTQAADKSDARYETIVFVKSHSKGWQLCHWHV